MFVFDSTATAAIGRAPGCRSRHICECVCMFVFHGTVTAAVAPGCRFRQELESYKKAIGSGGLGGIQVSVLMALLLWFEMSHLT